MGQVNDKILTAVILMERIFPRLNVNNRAPISRARLRSIDQSIAMVLEKLNEDCKQSLIITPLIEIMQLIDNLEHDDNFIETDAETKELIIDRMDSALDELYLFAGKFYMDHEFTWALTQSETLRAIVDACISKGFYFGVDNELRAEGVI